MLMKQPNNGALITYKKKKIIKCFILDINATTTSKLLAINKNTINRYFNIFRQAIYEYQMEKFDNLIGHIELVESYFLLHFVRNCKQKVLLEEIKLN